MPGLRKTSRSVSNYLVILATSALIGGCSQRTADSALKVVVQLDPQIKATCVRVLASTPGGTEKASTSMVRQDKDQLLVAVYRGTDLPETVSLRAVGLVGQGCEEPLAVNEEGPVQSGTFRQGETPEVILRLQNAENDEDRDGYRAFGVGGPDCDDTQPAVNPGAAEDCADGVENDCRGGADCADPRCEAKPCPTGVCNGGLCGVPATEIVCDNNADDDQDGSGDCADPDCEARTCLVEACVAGSVCSAGACTGGGPRVCDQPPNPECFDTPGVCTPGTGCGYTVKDGQACAGGFCNAQGACAPLFRYTPSNFVPPEPAAFDDPVDLSCGGLLTFDSSGAGAGPWCANQPTPRLREIILPDGNPAVLIALRGLKIGAGTELQLIGTRPLVIAVYGDVVIQGSLNASSSSSGAGRRGAGSGAADGCAAGDGAASGGGGGGGGLGQVGGQGGASFQAGAGGTGGPASGDAALVPLRAGCPGGAGGRSGGAGGLGGGAVQISATGKVSVVGSTGAANGRLAAAGAGGEGGKRTSGGGGGGGGGAGGALLIEADTVEVSGAAKITANGGGGGEGSGGSTEDGDSGNPGNPSTAVGAVGGAEDAPNGGDGGAGGTRSVSPLVGQPGTGAIAGGGGGGGGGTGIVRINARQGCSLGNNLDLVLSPRPSSDQPSCVK